MNNTKIQKIGNDTETDRLVNRLYCVPYLEKEYIEIGEDKYFMWIIYKHWAEKLQKFEVRDDDTFVIGFPRSGTTWTQEMVWLIVNDLNFEGAKEKQLKRAPLLEIDTFPNALSANQNPSWETHNDAITYTNGLKSPRCIKTHLPWSLLPLQMTDGSKQPKMIYILRNPKDVCISYYNFYRLFNGFKGSFEDYCLLFLEGRVINGPFWESVLSFWRQRHRSNILFINYKDMKNDLSSIVKEVARFLGKELTQIQIKQLLDYLGIEEMRKNPAVNRDDAVENYAKPFNLMISEKNNFIGKGEQSGYLSIMSPEMIMKFDKWTKKHLEGTDLVME